MHGAMRSLLTWVVVPFAAFAEPRVIAVLPPQSAALGGPSIDLETRLGHSPDVTLISRGAQLEIIRGLQLKKDPKPDDKLALKLGKLAGCDAVVTGVEGTWRLCRLPEGTCSGVDGANAEAAATSVLAKVGAKAPPARSEPWPDETKSAEALTAYASCRAAVSLAIEQLAIKGRQTKLKGLDRDCKVALNADGSYAQPKAALAAAQALQADSTADIDLDVAIEDMPNDPLPPAALVYMLLSTDREQDALKTLAAAEKRAPQALDLKRLRAERLFNLGQYKEAEPVFEAALKLAPRSPYLHWRLAYTLHMDGSDAEALKHAELASQLSGGDHPFYQEEYASRLVDVGRYEDAQKILEPLRKADKGWGRIALRLGQALHMQGKSKEGLTLLAEASKAKPRDPREKEDALLAERFMVRAQAKLGAADVALKHLAQMKAAGTLNAADLKNEDFDSVRDDPRFAELAAP
jgi:tetratricopeptide (TPR) repeat protein